MPTYEYECKHCGHTFDKFQGMKDKPLQRCPKCRHKLRKLMGTGAGIIFKGTGFYETDYRRKGSVSKESAGSESGSSSKSKSND